MTELNKYIPAVYSRFPLKYLLAFFFALQLLYGLFPYENCLSFDESIWHYIGRNWFTQGMTPYEGGVDNKSPLIFAIYGLSDNLFGVNFIFPRLLGIAVQTIGIWYLFKTIDHLSGRLAANIGVTIYGLSLLWYGTGGKYVSGTEVYAITFVIVAVYKYVSSTKNKDMLFCGVLMGIALCFRLSAIFGIMALGLVLIRQADKKKLFFFLGGLIFTGILFIVFLLLVRIDIRDFFTYSITENFGTGSISGRSISWKINELTNSLLFTELLLFLPVVTAYVLYKKKDPLLSYWLILECLGIILIGLFARHHFKNLLPPLSITGGILAAHLITKHQLSARNFMIVLWISFFPKSIEPLMSIKNLITGQDKKITENVTFQNGETKKRLGRWIKANTRFEERVYIAGYGAQIQVYSERLSPSVYFNFTQTRKAKQRLFNDLRTNKPAFILIPQSGQYRNAADQEIPQLIDQLIEREYILVKELYGYSIYKQKQLTLFENR